MEKVWHIKIQLENYLLYNSFPELLALTSGSQICMCITIICDNFIYLGFSPKDLDSFYLPYNTSNGLSFKTFLVDSNMQISLGTTLSSLVSPLYVRFFLNTSLDLSGFCYLSFRTSVRFMSAGYSLFFFLPSTWPDADADAQYFLSEIIHLFTLLFLVFFILTFWHLLVFHSLIWWYIICHEYYTDIARISEWINGLLFLFLKLWC